MQVEEALEYLRAAGLSGAAKYAAGSVFRRVDEAQKIPPALEREAEMVLARVGEAWSKLVSLPPGARANPKPHNPKNGTLKLAFVQADFAPAGCVQEPFTFQERQP